MKVYIVMYFDHEEYKIGPVFYDKRDAVEEAEKDLMGFDVVEEREVRGTP